MLDAANHLAPDLLLREQADIGQPAQMKGQRRGRHIETRLYLADGEARGSGLDQQPVDIETGRIAEFGQTSGGKSTIHFWPTLRQQKKLQYWFYSLIYRQLQVAGRRAKRIET